MTINWFLLFLCSTSGLFFYQPLILTEQEMESRKKNIGEEKKKNTKLTLSSENRLHARFTEQFKW